MKNQKKAYLYAGLTILCWSTVATAFKFGLRYQSPLQMVSGASILAFGILALALIISGKWRQVFQASRKQYLTSAVLGFMNPFSYYLILFYAYSQLPAQVAQPVNMIWPVVMVLLSVPLLRQKLHFSGIAGTLISFTGVFLISSQGAGKGFHLQQIPGILLCLASSIIWSLYWIWNVRDSRDELIKLFMNFFFALIYIEIFAFIKSPILPSGRDAWFWAAWAGIFEMGIAFIFWLKALQFSERTDKISNLIYISPFISLLFIHYFIGEPVYITTLTGLFLIISGILVQNMVWKQKKTKQPTG